MSTPLPRRAALLALGAGLGAAVAGCARVREATADVGRHLGLGDVVQTNRTFTSAARGGTATTWRVLAPREHDGPLHPVIYLHGLGGDHAHSLERSAATGPLLAARDAGGRALALVTVDGGTTYFHRRRSGEDAGEMIVRELLPRMRDEAGLDVSAVGLAGFSMGGYGALLLASEWDPARTPTGSRLTGVAVCEPALWLTPGDSAPGAFDDREDFLRNDVFSATRLAALRRSPVWLTRGDRGAFPDADARMQDALGCPGGVVSGRHDETLQRDVAATQFGFLHERLA